MACDINSARATFERSKARATKLLETMKITKEGEVLENTVAIAEKALELLDKKAYSELTEFGQKEFAYNLATSVTREEIGGVFSASIGKNPATESQKEFVLKSVQHRNSEANGNILELNVAEEGSSEIKTFTFLRGSNRSRARSGAVETMYIPNFDAIFDKVVGRVEGTHQSLTRSIEAENTRNAVNEAEELLNATDNIDELLASAKDMDAEKFKYTKKSKRTKYKHGSVEDMKNMLADLHAIGGKKATKDQYEHYENLLGNMHEGFFRKMNLYINEGQNDNRGWVDLGKKRILLNISSNTDSDMSSAEVYMHEIIHTMTAWALKNGSQQAKELKERLNYLRNQAYKNITWQDLYKADDRMTVEGAKERFDYIFTSETADDEFLAFALTNPAFMGLLKNVKRKDTKSTGFFSAIVNFFAEVMNAVMGNTSFKLKDDGLDKDIVELAFKLGEINNKAAEDLDSNSNIIIKAWDGVSVIEGRFEEWANKYGKKIIDPDGNVTIPKDMNTAQKVMFYAKFFMKALYNPNYRHVAGRYMSMLKIKPTSTFREIMRSITPSVLEDVTLAPEFLGLRASNTDLARNVHVGLTANSVMTKFKKRLLDSEQVSLTNIIMESNASTLFTNDKNLGKGYSVSQIHKLLKDTKYRKKAMNALERRIQKSAKDRGNWVVGQALGLGKFMATGKGHKAQNTNSENIVKGYLSSTRHDLDPKLVSLVQELASLSAIDRQTIKDRDAVANLISREQEGVLNVVRLYEAAKQNSKASLFKGDASHIMEGYIKELYDDGMESMYSVMSNKEELEKQGFKLMSVHESNDLSGAEAIGFFVSDSYMRPERLSGAVSLGNPNSRGMTLKEARYTQFHDSTQHAQVWFEADRAKMNSDAVDITKQLEEGVNIDDIEEGPVPVLDATGNVADYRNMMTKSAKTKFLKQNKKIADVLSKTAGSIIDKTLKEDQNSKVLEGIREDLKVNYDNPNSKHRQLEYTLISANSENPELRKLFYQLPKSFQRFANSRADKALPIPSMLMHTYFGYSQYRTTDLPGLRNLNSSIKRVINMFEKIFMDLVKIAKGNILLKMPAVLIVNIVSNLLYAINTGTNPVELVKEYTRSTRNVHHFMQKHKKLESKKVELLGVTQEYNTTRFSDAKELSAYADKTKRLKDEITRLEKELKSSDINELFELGMYQAVIEDVDMYKLGDTNVVSDMANKITSNMPNMVKTPIDILFLTSETKWYKTNQYILQMSDLVARDVMNRKQKIIEVDQANKKRELPLWYREHIGRIEPRKVKLEGRERQEFFDMSKRHRHGQLLKAFVNYNLPNGRGEEYLNRIGVLMFTKYVKRIQQVIVETGTKHPIRTIMTLLGANYMMGLETIQDQSFIIKAGGDYGVFGLTPLYSPLDVLTTVVNPPLINLGQSLSSTF